GRPGAGRWRDWASGLARRFREHFWLDGYPAIALDGDGRRVDTVTSNIGHLLGTGLLNDAEQGRVAARLAAPDMDSGFGLRTMASTCGGSHPLDFPRGAGGPADPAVRPGGPAAAAARQPHRRAARRGRGVRGAPARAVRRSRRPLPACVPATGLVGGRGDRAT